MNHYDKPFSGWTLISRSEDGAGSPNGHHSPFLVSKIFLFFYLILFWTLRREREREREREKQWLVLLSCSLRVHLFAFGSRFPNEREIRRSRFILERIFQYSTLLTFILYTHLFSLSDYSSTTRTRTLCAGYFGIPNALVPRSSRTWIKFFVLFSVYFNYSFLFSFLRSIDRLLLLLLLLHPMHFTSGLVR